MRSAGMVIAKLLLAYVIAGATLVMYVRRTNFGGHADVPFSGFPEFLIWSPLAPAIILSEYSEHRMEGVISLLVFGVAFAVVALLALRRRK